ncbi:MAG: D-alanyl-D-alanine carboxypeptidase family protein [Timaviella obliquedivisa GSE-PSE-MK23-08B]|nr:D-alanyl-D-alanine carboxypeptidase family protein [Timaviella obliquedivisa GSE-PSE-MK23-08B]
MDDAGLPKVPKRLSEYSASQHDDLPEAYRELRDEPRKSKKSLKFIGLAIAAFLLVILPFIWFNLRPQPTALSANSTEQRSGQPSGAVISSSTTVPLPSSSSATASPDQVLGHYRYAEVPLSDLEPVANDIKMHKAAAPKFLAMVDAAQAEGVSLTILSGFRSVEEQTHLFFDVKAERGQNTDTRADVSAPPGYSEHHTGYSADIGDANEPGTHLSQSFEQTAAFKWLQQNAAYYSFELSFAKGNPEKVSYEPWHWRYVGDRKSLEIFYRTRKK